MIIPSLDIYKNKVVRLLKGNINYFFFFGYFKEYVNFYNSLNIKKIHIVLLDNIFLDKKNYITVNKKSTYQIGGGLKNLNSIKIFLKKNFKKFVLSSMIFKKKLEFKKTLSYFKKKIVISLDCYKNFVTINGWKTITNIKFEQIFLYLFDLNIKNIIYTNIEKDGTLSGLNNQELLFLINKIYLCNFCISGGIKNYENLKDIINKYNFDYIVGISLYKFLMKIKYLC
ncbi:HisA/HisF-related TIM barrel protein [Candidatus Carsonella ruddii]|uniref:HisA/HisF-related TIM barrel protein n=3 Tax=cellular organisms TaxID=131567 RepID=A0AAJ6FDX9_CARRU|nr:HisA/HisF-related TIM barrel protein [Candidatus Carsonella ruddii]WGS66739.1 HisA/HisF-related TIM barrel protein [Candidatus Carsonella ruddii]WGS66933.1 HisA/HisF-related TIM barrel protein [Candidatus Carsonella ruddii]WGS67125.1 HisA/HisF-related TIM barrel protein [Candidatus Carsonella ruddii]WGS67317.1 HisA/HisF-related TIM barrel protein [Candidatus Carsonella ruddii]WMC18335.1 MAG: HisA/HisF-related TIM barrel protein [Candidatus Carsonella ruddii]